MATLIKNIKSLFGTGNKTGVLRGKDLSILPVINNAFLLIEDGLIVDFGEMEKLTEQIKHLPQNVIDVTGQFILPAWCDSHTHLVFSGSRESEFVDKINGLSYAEIAAKGGGILNSAARLAEVSEDSLFNDAWKRLKEISALGTGAVEIKSGYGLSTEAELKMLRVIKRLKEKSSLVIKSSFLGAHTFPLAYKNNHEEYIKIIREEMLPVIAAEKLADYIDVFCETGFFSPQEMESICLEGKKFGLKPKLHINQLNSIGGLQTALKLNAVSVDHLETMTEQDVRDLSSSDTIGTLLPTAAFFLRMDYQPARRMIDAGCAISLASDYNPGSSPSGNMNFVVSLSCIQMKMSPEEAINAATINGAHAMEVGDRVGNIEIGKKANLIFTKPVSSLAYLPYAFGNNHIDKVMINGEFINN